MGSMLFNTLYIVILALVFSFITGLPAGVYLAEYAEQGKLTHWVRMAIETSGFAAQHRGRPVRLPGLYRHDSQPVESAGRFT
jgi:hypothetical protein